MVVDREHADDAIGARLQSSNTITGYNNPDRAVLRHNDNSQLYEIGALATGAVKEKYQEEVSYSLHDSGLKLARRIGSL